MFRSSRKAHAPKSNVPKQKKKTKKMSIKKDLSMNPFMKWRRYRKPPYKLFRHVTLLFLVGIVIYYV